MQDSLFTKIIKGEVPSYRIYEDDHLFAFLDIHPITPGHVLVVPKVQVPFVWDLADDEYQFLMEGVKKIALHQRAVLEVPYIGEQIIGVDVPHAHIHLVPFSTPAEYHNRPDSTALPDQEALTVMAKRLRF
jgi:histidine triad (HIT) family protein